jgi:microcystin-dependent protein
MAATTRAGLRYPALTDTPDVVRDVTNLASDADATLAMYSENTFANRPAAGKHGRLFFATDQTKLYYDYGGGWLDLSPSVAPGPGSITQAMLAAGVSVVPIGGMMDWPWRAVDIPSWAVICIGQSLTQAAYGTLFALASAAGFLYGGSGTNFNLPDFRGRLAAGADDMGGTDAGRITIAISGTSGGLGAIAGSEGVVLTTAQIPAHHHSIGVSSIGSGPGSSGILASFTGATDTTDTGGGGAHSSMQPTIFVNKMMRVL